MSAAGAESHTVASLAPTQQPVELRPRVSTELHPHLRIRPLHDEHLGLLLLHPGRPRHVDVDETALDNLLLPMYDIAGLALIVTLITVADPGNYQIFLMAPHNTGASVSVVQPGVGRKWRTSGLTGQL